MNIVDLSWCRDLWKCGCVLSVCVCEGCLRMWVRVEMGRRGEWRRSAADRDSSWLSCESFLRCIF